MRITSCATPRGNVYRLYRTSDQFYVELKRLIPFILQSNVDVEIGPDDEDSNVLLTIGPFEDDADRDFRSRIDRFLT